MIQHQFGSATSETRNRDKRRHGKSCHALLQYTIPVDKCCFVMIFSSILLFFFFFSGLRPDFTSKLVHVLAFGTPKFYIAHYDKIKYKLVNLSFNCDVKSGLSIAYQINPYIKWSLEYISIQSFHFFFN